MQETFHIQVICASKVILQLSLLANNKSAEHFKIPPGFIKANGYRRNPGSTQFNPEAVRIPNEIKPTFFLKSNGMIRAIIIDDEAHALIHFPCC